LQRRKARRREEREKARAAVVVAQAGARGQEVALEEVRPNTEGP